MVWVLGWVVDGVVCTGGGGGRRGRGHVAIAIVLRGRSTCRRRRGHCVCVCVCVCVRVCECVRVIRTPIKTQRRQIFPCNTKSIKHPMCIRILMGLYWWVKG